MTIAPFLALLAALQTAPAPGPAAPPARPLGGPLVAGVCLLSREAVFANAKVALAANQRLQQLAASAQAEVAAQRKPIETEIEKLRATAATLTPQQRHDREQALTARLGPVQALADQRSREIEATRAKALQRIAVELQPEIERAYSDKKCGLLVDRTSVLGGNFGNDLTPAVVVGMDARMTTIGFERETLPGPAAAN